MPCPSAQTVEGHDSLYECIYCRRRADASAFNREHVLSEAFGKFKNALVLHEFVCRDCNRFYGDGIERELTRDAFEAMLRYQKHVKRPDDGPIRMQHVEVTVPEGGASAGVRLQLTGVAGDVSFRPAPQVGALDDDGKWVYLTAWEIDSGLLEQHPHFRRKGVQLRIFAANPGEHSLLVDKLASHGVNYSQSGSLTTADQLLGTCGSEVEVAFTLNQNVRRCIAKYALNYLACTCNSRFTLAPEFDAVREFARYGKLPGYPMVRAHFGPILALDQPTLRQTDGHLIVVSWDNSLNSLTCQVSAFNYVTYDVVLCRELKSAVWRPIRSGHHYDIFDMTVRPITGISKSIAS